MELILASASLRRRELLSEEKIPFSIQPSSFQEGACALPPKETCLSFARGKARDVFEKHPGNAVLGADTVVEMDGKIFSKPKDIQEAQDTLLSLSGKTHSVHTGVCLLFENRELFKVVTTKVEFNVLSLELIDEYIETMRPFDKAGAYGIQDGYPLVKKIEGSYTNVVGLPMETVREFLKEAKIC